ncbi:MAG TPA: ribbon-helix-helix protein, CopG family [Tepidisphaeraceae bacterium]|nr:ribbon-helix-helix protein, CopG family [Tepidisphaeraceae bacterium]
MKRNDKYPEDMTASELAKATEQFNKPFVFEDTRPMTRAERAEEHRLRRVRPRVAQGTKKISVSLENRLLKRADAMAKRRGINRSELITQFVAAGLERQAV